MIVAFTGPEHPKCGNSSARALMAAALSRDLYSKMSQELELRTGAAYGIDTIAYFACVAAFPRQRHHVLVPTGLRYNQDLVIFAKQEGHTITGVPGGYLKRDDALVAGADRLMAFPNSMREEQRSGTWATIRRAWKAGVEVRYWPLDRQYGPVIRLRK